MQPRITPQNTGNYASQCFVHEESQELEAIPDEASLLVSILSVLFCRNSISKEVVFHNEIRRATDRSGTNFAFSELYASIISYPLDCWGKTEEINNRSFTAR